MRVVLIGTGLLMIAATVLPLARRDDWWIRIFDFPRLQITFVLAVTLALYWWTGEEPDLAENVFLAALGACLVYQAVRMYPYTPLARKEALASRRATEDSTISLLFANVLMKNRDAQTLLRLIGERDPDVVLAVETDAWWDNALSELSQSYQHSVLHPQDNTYGMLLYSRLELREPKLKFLIDDDVPSIHTRAVLRSGQEVELRCLHPRPPVPEESERSTERDAELLIVAKELRETRRPAIVFGDMNDVAWSHTNDLFRSISGLLDPRIGRGFYATFNAHWPLIRFPLDHVFHSRHFRVVKFERLPRWRSDHFPVYIKLGYEPEPESEQGPEPATKDEHEEAGEKIAQARRLHGKGEGGEIRPA